MKVAIIGSRHIERYDMQALLRYMPENVTAIISGGAKGIDALAEVFASSQNLPLLKILPNYAKYGKRAPLMRNKEIVRKADCVLAIWDYKSRGTAHAIVCCIEQGTPVRVLGAIDS